VCSKQIEPPILSQSGDRAAKQLGTQPTEKRHIVLDSGHGLPLTLWYKESLIWLDHYWRSVQ
jgi:hypothetical protein